MDDHPRGIWNIQRPNIGSWSDDLDKAISSNGVTSARASIIQLGHHLNDLLSYPAAEDLPEDEEPSALADTRMPPPLDLLSSSHGTRRSAQDDSLIVNDVPVSPPPRLWFC